MALREPAERRSSRRPASQENAATTRTSPNTSAPFWKLAARAEVPGLLDAAREKGSELLGRRPQSGLLLLRHLRKLSSLASEVSINWVILGQGARAAKDAELLGTVTECHAQNLRGLKWANTMIKQIAPQVLTS